MPENQNPKKEATEDNAIVRIHVDVNLDDLDTVIDAVAEGIDELVYYKMQLAFIKANREKKQRDAAFIRYCFTGRFD